MHIEGMLLQLQKYISKASSSLLYIKNSFGVNGQWCFMTEFYPRNLKQALEENNQGFHIDLVQILSRQLVAAVNMLTNNNIIHSGMYVPLFTFNKSFVCIKHGLEWCNIIIKIVHTCF